MAKHTSANLGFEEKLWAAADKMRSNMDPSEYKHVVLGLIFLKYISDSFEECMYLIKKEPNSKSGKYTTKIPTRREIFFGFHLRSLEFSSPKRQESGNRKVG